MAQHTDSGDGQRDTQNGETLKGQKPESSAPESSASKGSALKKEALKNSGLENSALQKPASTKLNTRDLITLGVYAALYIVVMVVAGMFFAFSPVLTYLTPVSDALFCAPIYLLLVAKVPRRGAISVLGIVVGLVLFVTGMFWLWALTAAILGVVADQIAASGKFRNKTLNTLSYTVFALAPLGSYAMVWINQSAYLDYLIGKGTDPAYMDTMIQVASPWLLVGLVVGIVVAARLGTLLGRRLLARHFTRAGILA